MSITNKMNNEVTKNILIFVVLCILGLIIYYQSFNFPFVNLDDIIYLHAIKSVGDGFSNNVDWLLTSIVNSNYHPITLLSLIIDYKIYNGNPAGFHVTNFVLHIVNSAFVFLVFSKLSNDKFIGFIVACLFVVHPLNVETVAWISERKGILSTLFLLMSVYFYIKNKEDNRGVYIISSLGLYGLALMSKAVVVILPLLLIAIDYYIQSSIKSTVKKTILKLAWDKKYYFILSLLFGLVAIYSHYSSGVILTEGTLAFNDRLFNVVNSYVIYILQMVYPFNLYVGYPNEIHTSWKILFYLCVLIGISWFAYREKDNEPFILFGWLWFIISLLPVIGIIQSGSHSHADRYAYVSLLGLFFIIAFCISNIKQNLSKYFYLLTMSIVLFFMCISYEQVKIWRNSEALYENVLLYDSGSYFANINMATSNILNGNFEKANVYYQAAKNNRAEYKIIYHAMANAFLKVGKYDYAVNVLEDALDLNKNNYLIYRKIAQIRINQSKYDLAIIALKKSLNLFKTDLSIYLLGHAYFYKGDLIKSEKSLSLLNKLSSNRSGSVFLLARIYKKQGKIKEMNLMLSELKDKNPEVYYKHINSFK